MWISDVDKILYCLLSKAWLGKKGTYKKCIKGLLSEQEERETGHWTHQSDKLLYSIKIRQAIDRDVELCKSRTSLFILRIKWSCLLKWTSGETLSIVLERANNWPRPEKRREGAKTLWCLRGRKLNRICNLFGISL